MGTDDLFRKKRDERRAKKISSRKENIKEIKKRILIVCEGEKTEPHYFEGFRVPTLELAVEGGRNQADKVVEAAICCKKKAESIKSPFDEVWCVFDKDDVEWGKISRAYDLAKNNNIRIAYSNEAFELWYVLHFVYLDAQIKRHDYCDKLSGYITQYLKGNSIIGSEIKYKYQKNSKDMYALLRAKRNDAIRNAEKLIEFHGGFSIQCKPVTTVHELVKELIKNQ